MPALAQAYGGGGSFSAADKAVFVLCLLAPFVVPPTLMLWAYLRPGKLGLQFGQGLVLVEFAWRWGKLQHDRSVRSMAEFRITSMRLCPWPCCSTA